MPISNDTRVNSALRLAGGYLGTALTVMATLSIIPQEQANELIAQFRILTDSIVAAVGALGKMWVIIFPIAVGILAKFGIQSNSLPAIIGKLLAKAKENTVEGTQAQTALVQATAQIAAAPDAALAHDAKVVLLDAVAAQPEVVGVIKVTDPKLAADTISTQVKAA